MTIQKGDSIEYVTTVTEPASQVGIIGDTKIVGKDISLFHARYLARGQFVKVVKPVTSEKPVKTAKKTK